MEPLVMREQCILREPLYNVALLHKPHNLQCNPKFAAFSDTFSEPEKSFGKGMGMEKMEEKGLS